MVFVFFLLHFYRTHPFSITLLCNIPNWTKDSVPARQEYDVTWLCKDLNLTRWQTHVSVIGYNFSMFSQR